MRIILVFVVCLLHNSNGYTGFAGPDHDKIVACYYTSWAVYRPGAGSFDIFDIEPSLCSHLIYSFMGLDENSFKIKSIDQWQDFEEDGGKGGLKRFVALKDKHKHLKTTVAIGGWNEGSSKYSKMAGDPKLRKIFVKSVVHFLTKHKLDGLDLFWDYPTKRGGKFEDRKNYVSLVKELSEAFEPNNFLLTASLRCGSEEMDSIYDLAEVNNYLDFMHIMAYDFHGSWDDVIGANAPLYGLSEDDTSSVEYSIRQLLKHEVTPSKIILDISTFGRTFFLINPKESIVFGETITKSEGFAGPFTNDHGFMGYNEICLEMSNKSSQWVQEWNEQTNTPYIRDDGKFISYDNPRSIANKVRFAMDFGLGGFAAWSLTTDDFRGACDEEKDTYKEYCDRYKSVVELPLLLDAILNLQEAGFQNEFYIVKDDKVELKLPKSTFSNYPLLTTVHDATSLALEETQIFNEMQRLSDYRRNEIEQNNFPCVRTCTEVCYYGFEGPQVSKMLRKKRHYDNVKPNKSWPVH